MNEQVLDKIYEETLNDQNMANMTRIERIRRYIELYKKYDKTARDNR